MASINRVNCGRETEKKPCFCGGDRAELFGAHQETEMS